MKMKIKFLLAAFTLCSLPLVAQVTVNVDATASPTPISKFIYGRNNSLSGDPGSVFTPEWTRLKDAGVTMFRESGGNNCTKYNWKKKLSSHPDWYNNVYAHDWGSAAQSLQNKMPGAYGMWAFQLLGKVAKTNTANFNDWGFNTSQWWNGVNQNLAGGGTPNPATWAQVSNPSTASTTTPTPGDTSKYLQNWPADSTVAILDNWFNDLGLKSDKFKYWNMDNEVEIWSGTHDDAMPTQLAADDFMQKYFAVAKAARAKFPGIKLVGPVTANEWQWYNWNGNPVTVGGKVYPWIEYFIKRVGEEEAATGIRLLDVLDIHFYPGSTTASDVVQMHRIYFDQTYDFPEANGIRKINGGYDVSLTKEYIFVRIQQWLDKYLPANHGVTLGVTETGVNITDASSVAVWYAGTLGEFMKHPQVEIFTPWTWKVGMWETLHLFSRFNKPNYLQGTSTDETNVSIYPSVNSAGDSITLALVNRSTSSKPTTVTFTGYVLTDDSFDLRTLSSLPATETFTSHSANALKKTSIQAAANRLTLTLPPMSVSTVTVKGAKGTFVTGTDADLADRALEIFPNPTSGKTTINIKTSGNSTLDLVGAKGEHIASIYNGFVPATFSTELDMTSLPKGLYIVKLAQGQRVICKKLVVK